MSLRERTMNSGFVRCESVYGFEGKWYYVASDRTIQGPYATRQQAQYSLDCTRVLDTAALQRVNSLQLAPI